VVLSVSLFVSALSAQDRSSESQSGQWRTAGQNLNNTWSQLTEHSISPGSVKGLTPGGLFTTGGDVSATPTVDGDAVYFPDWGGNLFAVNKDNFSLIWPHSWTRCGGHWMAVPGLPFSFQLAGQYLTAGSHLPREQITQHDRDHLDTTSRGKNQLGSQRNEL
jgi:hypothetical protein